MRRMKVKRGQPRAAQWVSAAAFVLCAAAIGRTQAPQPPTSGANVPAAPAARGRAAQALVPVAASTLAANPEAYVGMTVTLTAAVEQRYPGTAFTVDQDRSKTGAEVLVLAPLLTAPVEPRTYVTVIGEVVKFDAADAAARMRDSMPELPADVAARYKGHAAVIATSVINGAMTDLAKRIPPPMSPEELALSKVMKRIGPGFNALRTSATAANGADTAAQATELKTLFGEAAAFWKSQARPDAVQWTEDARSASGLVEAAAAKGDWEAVKLAVPRLQAACASCHGLYRERLDDGTYRFKPPAR
jgi:cytochrome c556